MMTRSAYLEAEALPLGPAHLPPCEYFVGPKQDGPAVIVHVTHHENSTLLSQGIHSIENYERPPHVGEDYDTWASETEADDIGFRYVEAQILEERVALGGPAVRHALQIKPPLKEQADIQKAAAVLGNQLLASREDPISPLMIVSRLVAAGIHFDSAKITTEVLSAHKAQDNPRF